MIAASGEEITVDREAKEVRLRITDATGRRICSPKLEPEWAWRLAELLARAASGQEQQGAPRVR